MITNFKTAFLCTLGLALAACGKDTPGGGTPAGDGERVELTVVPTVAGSGEGANLTRALVLGTEFRNTSIGVGVHAPAPTGVGPAAFFDNVEARNTYTTNGITSTSDWGYYLGGVYNGQYLSGFRSWGGIEVRGYFPYDRNVTDTSAIPFTIADDTATPGTFTGTSAEATKDHMVAVTAYKEMLTSTPPVVTLPFEHLMTAIEIFFYRQYNYTPPALFLDRVDFELTGGRVFEVAGTYTADNWDETQPAGSRSLGVDPVRDIHVTKTTSQMSIDYDQRIEVNNNPQDATAATAKTTLIIMPELRVNPGQGLNDGKLTMTFHFADADGQPYAFEHIPGGNPKVSFDLSAVSNAPDDAGLLAGYRYRVNASMQTYTHFSAPSAGYPSVVDRDLIDDPDITGEDFIHI